MKPDSTNIIKVYICTGLLALAIALFLLIPSCGEVADIKLDAKAQPLEKAQAIESEMTELAGLSVVFDQSKEQVYSPYDTGVSGCSKLAVMLKGHGAEVSINNQALELFLAETGIQTVLVLGVAMKAVYTETEIIAIEKFVHRGGDVLVFVEHGNFFENADFQNSLTDRFGIEALHESAEATGPSQRDRFWAHCRSDLWHMDDLVFYLAAPLKVEAPAEVLVIVANPLKQELSKVAAINRSNKGIFAVLGDMEIVWNMAPGHGIQHTNNRRFILQLFLTFQSKQKYYQNLPDTERVERKPLDSKGKVLIDTAALSLDIDSSPGGLSKLAKALRAEGYSVQAGGGPKTAYETFDLVILAVPLAAHPDPEGVGRAGKLILASDGQSDLFVAFPELGDIMRREGLQFPEITLNPINNIASKEGLAFEATTLVQKEFNHLMPHARWLKTGKKLSLHRSTCIQAVDRVFPKGARILAMADRDCWKLASITPKFEGKDTRIFPPPPNKMSECPVVVATDKTFLLADVDNLANQSFDSPNGKILYEEILRWLRSKS